MDHTALAGIRILDLSTGIAGPFCTRQLAALGADVLKVEPPDGDPSRGWGPFAGDTPHPEASIPFLYLNTGKRSVVVDLATDAGRAAVERLAGEADVLVESFAPGTLVALGLAPEKLEAANPRLIITSITAYGQDGPYRDDAADEIQLYARGGLMGITGEHERGPLKNGGFQAQYQTGLSALTGTLMALYAQLGDGQGQRVDVSSMETVALMVEPYLVWNYARQGTQRGRVGNHGIIPPRGTWPCKDGWVTVVPSLWRNWDAFYRMTGIEALRDARFATNEGRAQHADEIMALLIPWMLEHTRVEVYHAAQREGMPFGYVANVAEIFTSPQLQARGYFQTIDHPIAGPLPYAGAPVRFSDTPFRFSRAPLLGEHTDTVLAELQTNAGAGWPAVAAPPRED